MVCWRQEYQRRAGTVKRHPLDKLMNRLSLLALLEGVHNPGKRVPLHLCRLLVRLEED